MLFRVQLVSDIFGTFDLAVHSQTQSYCLLQLMSANLPKQIQRVCSSASAINADEIFMFALCVGILLLLLLLVRRFFNQPPSSPYQMRLTEN